MKCPRCNNIYNGNFCPYCGNKTKKPNYILIAVILVIVFIVIVTTLFRFVIYPNLMFDKDHTKINSEYKLKILLEKKYNVVSYDILDKKEEEVSSGSCGDYTEYTWTILDIDTQDEFTIISSYRYDGAFVCRPYNYKTEKKA